jgi:hypothetical protein
MRDEIFLQVLKQLNGNPDRQSVEKGLEALLLLAATFCPSEEVERFVVMAARRYGGGEAVPSQCVEDALNNTQFYNQGKKPTSGRVQARLEELGATIAAPEQSTQAA